MSTAILIRWTKGSDQIQYSLHEDEEAASAFVATHRAGKLRPEIGNGKTTAGARTLELAPHSALAGHATLSGPAQGGWIDVQKDKLASDLRALFRKVGGEKNLPLVVLKIPEQPNASSETRAHRQDRKPKPPPGPSHQPPAA